MRGLAVRDQQWCRNLALRDQPGVARGDVASALHASAAEADEFVARGLQLAVLQMDPATDEVRLQGLLREYIRNSRPSMDDSRFKEAEQRARAVLVGQTLPLPEIIKLAETLKDGRRFGLARRILDRWADKPEVTENPDLRLRLKFA